MSFRVPLAGVDSSAVGPVPSGTESATPSVRTDGGGTFVPVQTRSERPASDDIDDFPKVTGLEAEWKFTPVKHLRDLIDGTLDGTQIESTVHLEGDASVTFAGRSAAGVRSAGLPEDRASANAWGAATSIRMIDLRGEAASAHLTTSALDSIPRAAHTIITAHAASDGRVVLEHSGSGRLAENVEIVVEDGARLTVVSVQEWDTDAAHLSSHIARVDRGGVLRHVVVTLGAGTIRLNPTVHLVGEGAEVELFGAYFSGAGQHVEHQVYVDHEAPRTRSRVTYKGALQGSGARTVWIGDVLIRRTATGTDSYEQNRNLLLSDGARADSIPNLEIETGDIVGAGHASASGRFDDEQLFYLQARGIDEDEARRLVVSGFLTEVVQKVGNQALEERLHTAIRTALAENGRIAG